MLFGALSDNGINERPGPISQVGVVSPGRLRKEHAARGFHLVDDLPHMLLCDPGQIPPLVSSSVKCRLLRFLPPQTFVIRFRVAALGRTF